MTNLNPHSLYWFVAYVKSCQERRVAEFLAGMGVECYVPIRKERRKWSDRVKVVDKLVLPRIVFIKCTPTRRLELQKALVSRITGYMSAGGPYNPVVIPEQQMMDFKLVVSEGEGEVRISNETLLPGDIVEILVGPLKGLQCELVTLESKKYVAVRLGLLGAAVVEVPLNNVKKIQ